MYYGGDVIEWQPSGGTLLFWRRRCRDHAIMSALKVLHNLPILNLDLEQNPLGDRAEGIARLDDVLVTRACDGRPGQRRLTRLSRRARASSADRV